MPFLRALTLVIAFSAPALAQRLPVTALPEHYDLAFDVNLGAARFEGRETIRVQLPAPTTRIVLHALDITFREATVGVEGNRQKAAVALDPKAQTATLTVPRAIPAGPAEIDIRFAGILNNQLRGFYLSRANGRSYGVSQLESTDARRAFPCFDEPALKATFAVTMTIDRRDTAISNGKVISDTPGPGPDRHTLKFDTSPKMSTYLVALAVGDFECLEGGADGVPIRVCTIAGKRALGKAALESAEFILHFYNGYYSIRYPFKKLDLLAVPDFAAGAMENTAAIFFRDTDLLVDPGTTSVPALKNVANVVAHEMAHQWFGDLVTMKWWDDLWLNEGFATWMETQPLAAWKPEWNMDVDEALSTGQALNLDSLKSTHPIHTNVLTPTEIDESFDAISYQKGAAVLRMAEGFVGRDAFRQGVNTYLEQHAYGNATSEDFWTAIAKASGKPVDSVLRTFVNTAGVPLLTVSASCRDQTSWSMRVQQERFFLNAAPSSSAAPGDWAIPICLKTPGPQAGACSLLQRPEETMGVSDAACPAWLFANAGAKGYYRTAYSPELLRGLATHVETALTPAERVSLASDAWALVRAGRQRAADFLTLASGFGSEQTAGVLSEITSGLSFIHDYLAPPAARADYEAFIRTLLGPQVRNLGLSAAPGESDERRELRAVVVDTLASVGNDEQLMRQATMLTTDALAGRATLDATAGDAIVSAAARRGDRALWDALAAAADRATAPEEQYRYLYALADFEDPALVQRGLEHALSPGFRSQNMGRYLARFLSNPAVHSSAWSFVKQHWTELEPKMSVAFADVRIVQALGSFCDPRDRDDIKSFLASHKLGSAARTVDQAIERIDNCIAIREAHKDDLAEWLRRR